MFSILPMMSIVHRGGGPLGFAELKNEKLRIPALAQSL